MESKEGIHDVSRGSDIQITSSKLKIKKVI